MDRIETLISKVLQGESAADAVTETVTAASVGAGTQTALGTGRPETPGDWLGNSKRKLMKSARLGHQRTGEVHHVVVHKNNREAEVVSDSDLKQAAGHESRFHVIYSSKVKK